MKRKTSQDVSESLLPILKSIKKRKSNLNSTSKTEPRILADYGSEFISGYFKSFSKNQKFELHFAGVKGRRKLPHIERLIRYIKLPFPCYQF